YWSDIPVGIIDGETTTVEIPVLKVGRLTGIVKDNKGRPLPNVWLEAYSTNSDHYYGSEGRTDSQGRFAVSSVLPVPFYLNFRPYGRDIILGPFLAERYNDKDRVFTLDIDSQTSAADHAAWARRDASTTKTYQLTGS